MLRGVAAVAVFALTATLGLFTSPVAAQTAFSVGIGVDRLGDPPLYAYGETVTVTVTINAGSTIPSGIGFAVNLPTGVSFVSAPAASQCNGTVSSTATQFSLAGGSLAEDASCTIVAKVKSTPSTDTTYSIQLGTVTYTWNAYTFTDTSHPAQSFEVQAGQPPTYPYLYDDYGSVGEEFYRYVYVAGTAPIAQTATGLPPGLTFDPVSSHITGFPTTLGTYTVHMHATNAFGAGDGTFTIEIDPPYFSATKAFAPASIQTGGASTMNIVLTAREYWAEGIAFEDAFPAGMRATSPGEYAVCGGTLDVTATSLTFTDGYVEVDDDEDPSAMASCTISVPVTATATSTRTLTNTLQNLRMEGEGAIYFVNPSGTLNVAAAAPKITSAPPPNTVVGATYRYVVTVTGNTPIAVTVTGLPPGLTYAAGSHTILGTPTTTGSYAGSIKATNGIAPDAVQNFTIVVSAPPLAITTDTLPPITGGSSVNTPITAAGGLPPYTFKVLSGTLPPGLSFTPTGYLTGTPTAPGTFTFTVQVTDSVGTTAVHAYTVTIAQGTPTFLFDVLPNPVVSGEAVTVTAMVAGGAAIPSGQVQVWLAHSYERCPFVAGSAPVAATTRTATLGSSGTAQFSFADLPIDNYEVCGTYAGNATYVTVNAGPVDVFVIKGVLLGTPAVSLHVPSRVVATHAVGASVVITPPATSTRAPGGSVLLRANGAVVGTAPVVDGAATFTLQAPASPGTLIVSASYLGDGAYTPAVAPSALVQVGPLRDDPAPTPVPALAEWALALLALLVGGAAATRLRTARTRAPRRR